MTAVRNPQQPHFQLVIGAAENSQTAPIADVVRAVVRSIFGKAATVELIGIADAANTDAIMALPLLVQLSPEPQRQFVGDFTDPVQLASCLREPARAADDGQAQGPAR